MILRIAALIVAILAAAPLAHAEKLKVVATFSILGDMTARVGGDKIALTTLVAPEADAHVFEPTPADARSVAAARLVIANGLGFEPWLDRLMKSTKARATLVIATQGVRTRTRAGDAHALDPHAWQDAHNATAYVGAIALALSEADPANGSFYRANGADYINEIAALDQEISLSFVKIPKAARRVITSHDAFGYFADAYFVDFRAPLGASTEAQASAKGVARLIEQIRREKIRAVFVENITDPRLIEQIAHETGVKIDGKLYSDALSKKGGPAPTYIAMMRHNAKLLTEAMARGL